MSTSNSSPSEKGRQRRLDDLFGEEPFLSPTMKARRLLDPAPALTAQDVSPAIPPRSVLFELVPDISEEEVAGFWMRRNSTPADQQSESGAVAQSEPDLLPTPRMLKLVQTMTARATRTAPAPPDRPEPVLEIVSADMDANVLPASGEGMKFDSAGGSSWAAGTTIPLAEAAAFLRSECPSNAAPPGLQPLEHFRNDVLVRWLKQVPTRDACRAIEE